MKPRYRAGVIPALFFVIARQPLGLFGLLLLVLGSGCTAPTRLLSGTLHGMQSWSGTIQIDGDLVVAADAEVRVAPGSEIVFLPPSVGTDQWQDHPHFPGSELIVHGVLLAEGTAAAPIVFRFVDPDAAAGSWGGVNLQEGRTARFRYCHFTQAQSAVHSSQTAVSIEDCRFEENRVAIRFHSSDIRIEHNLLQNNDTGIRFHFGAPTIRFNELLQNDKAFFITAEPRDYRIEANNILESRSYAVVLGEDVSKDVLMSNNWWGNRAREETFFDGRRIPYLGRVQIEPVAAAPFAAAGVR